MYCLLFIVYYIYSYEMSDVCYVTVYIILSNSTSNASYEIVSC